MRNLTAITAVLILLRAPLHGQISTFPYLESFDSLTNPSLPAGWTSSQNRNSGTNDFTSTASTPNSPPNALISTNATIEQFLLSPSFGFQDVKPDSLSFFLRRSSTHQSAVVVEASLDGGISFSLSLGDTLYNIGSTSYEQTIMPLPEPLAMLTAVVFRWRVIPGKSGTTGTLRIDDVAVTTREQYDLALTEVRFAPQPPAPDESLHVTTVVQNVGTDPLTGFQGSVFLDTNNDSSAQASELVATGENPGLLLPGSMGELILSRAALALGTHTLIVAILSALDRNPSNDSSVVVVNIGLPSASLVINEIMYAPIGSEPEWVEILNTSNDTIDLQDWKLSDNSSSAVILSQTDFPLPGGSFLVVTDDLEAFTAVHPAVPSPILTVGSLPALNNGGDAVVLYNDRGVTTDSISYVPAWGGLDGFSLERIDPLGQGIDQANWRSSLDTSGSTPGRQNSVVLLDDDIALVGLGEMSALASSPLEIELTVRNTGRRVAAGFSLLLYNDADRDSIPGAHELVLQSAVTDSLSPGDTVLVQLTWTDPPSGTHPVIVALDYAQDQRLRDNQAFGTARIGYEPGSLVVNEIMFEPFSGKAEYVELSNVGESTIDLDGWIIADRPGSDGEGNEFAISGPRSIHPGAFFVAASDSSVLLLMSSVIIDVTTVLISETELSLNNDGDDVVLKDPSGGVVDSVSYLPAWHLPGVVDPTGRSLEKIHPALDGKTSRSWSTCAKQEGGTPGQTNSIFSELPSGTSGMSFSPNPFSPDGDGYQDHTLVQYELSTGLALISIRIFDTRGRLIRTLVTREVSGIRGDVVWDGYDDEGQKARIGMYVVFLEAMRDDGTVLGTLKSVVVLAARL